MNVTAAHRRLAEAALACVVLAGLVLMMATATEPGSNPPGPTGYVFAVLIAAALPARHRWPLAVIGCTTALIVAYHLFNNPGISPVVALAVPLYSAAAAGRTRWAVGAAALSVFFAGWFSLVEDHQPAADVGRNRLFEAALLAVLILLGIVQRARRAEAAQARRDAERAALDRERDTSRRVTEERLRIARELHDVLAHTLAATAIQAAVAADTLTDAPATSAAAIESIRRSCREARDELAATVGLLRYEAGGPVPGADRAPPPGLGQLDALLRATRDAGPSTDVVVTGPARPLPPAVDLTAYRIVQQALTNVIQHSRAGTATVILSYRPDTVVVSVADPGPARATGSRGGHGLIGLRERATAVGGTLDAADQPGGGFLVSATLPSGAHA